MKNFYIIILFYFLAQSLQAQDIITTTKKNEVKAKIIEVTPHEVKYKMYDYLDGPILNIKLRNVENIKYENGQTNNLSSKNPRMIKNIGLSLGLQFDFDADNNDLIATFDYFVTPTIEFEINFGLMNSLNSPYFSLGGKYHINRIESKSPITPFIGALVGTTNNVTFFQLPIGVSYQSKIGIKSSFSFNQLTNFTTSYSFYEFRVGWNFHL